MRGPVDVIRYNLGTPIRPGTFAVDPLRSTEQISDEYGAYVNAVAQGLGGLGFSRVPDGSPSEYLLEISFARAAAGTVRTGSPVSIGLGGVSGGMGGAVGGGLSTALGGRTRQLVTSELTAKIRRRVDNTVTWEGAARTQGTLPETPAASAAQAARMADALFRDFPGQSGITTTVP
ncbi:DUF4136 domain-containing protein [Sphingomonas baiyangensis]|uniref:DUF4136 domain-containing protein n=1 Tax=Sphingomonas baiyangensis TaxID=2572576 RepID=UPI001BB0760B|nr:DUF4136 domain-containing protein [Sphingomonas baiyangensis]